nr:MAG TPA: hypothetical protein [Caudoviricetes sp.]
MIGIAATSFKCLICPTFHPSIFRIACMMASRSALK